MLHTVNCKSSVGMSARCLLILAALTVVLYSETFSQTSVETRTPTRKVILVSDNQENLMTGAPFLPMDGFIDKYVTVTLRSPLANVGGRLLFREAIKSGRQKGGEIVLHLGDASNISCPDELSSVITALNEEAGDSWFMVPGNHDGFLLGNFGTTETGPFSRPPNEEFQVRYPFKWVDSCAVPSRQHQAKILTRADAIDQYVGSLKKRGGIAPFETLPAEQVHYIDREHSMGCQFEFVNNPSQKFSAYARICGRIPKPLNDPEKRWTGPQHSFIVQRLEIGERHVIFLDTSDYEDPNNFPVVMMKGNITCRQKEYVDNLLLIDDNGKPINRDNVIMAGHHPFDDLSKDTQDWIGRSAARYISGHKHLHASISERKTKTKPVQELNIGSTLDYPPQMVLAEFSKDSIHVEAFGGGKGVADAAFLESCDASWRLSKDTYTRYRKGPYAKRLLEALREASARHDQLIKPLSQINVPTGDRISDWLLLEDILAKINAAKGDSRTFWACQAYYASEATRKEGGFITWAHQKNPKFKKKVRARTSF